MRVIPRTLYIICLLAWMTSVILYPPWVGRFYNPSHTKPGEYFRGGMKAMLERQTSMRDISVRGVVIFPGWNIDDGAYRQAGGDVWTLHHTAFNKWLRNGKEGVRLKPDEIALLSSRIEDHVRSIR